MFINDQYVVIVHALVIHESIGGPGEVERAL